MMAALNFRVINWGRFAFVIGCVICFGVALAVIALSLFNFHEQSVKLAQQNHRLTIQSSKLAQQTRRLAVLSAQNHTAVAALCFQRADVEDRVHIDQRAVASQRRRLAEARLYLRRYPNGLPGIPVGLIRSAIARDEKDLVSARRDLRQIKLTRQNLNILDCSKGN